jgi:hypothetical protein
VQGPVPEWPAVRFFVPRNRAGDADKLGAHLIGRQSDLRITVSPQIDELEVRSDPSQSIRPSALAQPIEASFAKPDLNAPTSVSISASVIGVENVHVPVLMMLQPSSWR